MDRTWNVEWWKESRGSNYIIIETDKVKPKTKSGAHIRLDYSDKGKLLKVQYKVLEGSKEHEKLIEELQITEKDFVRETE